jgi:[ribosomal protein S5]-alanine N-acetyltransferase
MESFTTTRMTAVPLELGDFGELCVMHRDPEVMRYMGGVRTDEQTERWMRDHFDHRHKYGFGCWIFRDRRDGRFVGRGLLRHAQLDNIDEVEVGYALVSEYWGMGLGTEMAKPLTAIAFETLELETLVALVDSPNVGSRRVAEKLGFHFERNTMWKSLPTMLFRLDRAQWREAEKTS